MVVEDFKYSALLEWNVVCMHKGILVISIDPMYSFYYFKWYYPCFIGIANNPFKNYFDVCSCACECVYLCVICMCMFNVICIFVYAWVYAYLGVIKGGTGFPLLWFLWIRVSFYSGSIVKASNFQQFSLQLRQCRVYKYEVLPGSYVSASM